MLLYTFYNNRWGRVFLYQRYVYINNFFCTNSSIKLIMFQHTKILVPGSKISTQRSVSTLFLTHLYFLSWLMSTQNIFTCSKIIVTYFKVWDNKVYQCASTKFTVLDFKVFGSPNHNYMLVQSSQFQISKFSFCVCGGGGYKSLLVCQYKVQCFSFSSFLGPESLLLWQYKVHSFGFQNFYGCKTLLLQYYKIHGFVFQSLFFGATKFITVILQKFIGSYFKVFWEANKIFNVIVKNSQLHIEIF